MYGVENAESDTLSATTATASPHAMLLLAALLLLAACCVLQPGMAPASSSHQYLTDLHLLQCVVVGLLQTLHSPASMDIRLAIAERSHQGSPSNEVLAANTCCRRS